MKGTITTEGHHLAIGYRKEFAFVGCPQDGPPEDCVFLIKPSEKMTGCNPIAIILPVANAAELAYELLKLTDSTLPSDEMVDIYAEEITKTPEKEAS